MRMAFIVGLMQNIFRIAVWSFTTKVQGFAQS